MHLLLLRKYDKAGRSPPRRDENLDALNDVDDLATALCAKLNRARYESEERVVATATNTFAGVEVGAALTNEDFAGLDDLTAVALHAEVLGVGVAPVTGG